MRFERQVSIAQIGENGQKKIRQSVVAVIGAGGLGSPVLSYLACVGVGEIYIIDGDVVSLSNLNRQFLYGYPDIGKSKAMRAAQLLEGNYHDVKFTAKQVMLDGENIDNILEKAEVIIDCVDNIATKMLLNDYAVKSKTPLIVGAITGFYGFMMTVMPESVSLRDIGYENTKEIEKIPAIGATAGVIGSLQASECIKIITGAGNLCVGKMLQYDGLNGEFDEIEVATP